MQRSAYEHGHKPKFLVIVDGSPESDRAIRFAARRAVRTASDLCMLSVITQPDDFEWIGVGEAIKAEAEAQAESFLETASQIAKDLIGIEAETLIRHGNASQEITKLIHEDSDISYLVLAASTNKDGPGPLVSSIAAKLAATFPIPIIIVPGALTDDEINALAG
ncbi:universal stress protein [Microvirga sp. W0021]|uniref:Universal stress protein n=1 Tax=Hohaiivirga grylli TaxID=3133970 RepID=A0ABV0BGD3_9HYPH